MPGAVRHYCIECNQFKLADSAKFRMVDGKFHNVCHACEKRIKKRKEYEEHRAKVSQLLQVAAKSIVSASSVPHPAEMLAQIIEASGGVKQFAIDFHLSRMASDPGGSVRAAYDKAVLKLITDNGLQGGARKPVTDLDLAEVEEELNKHLLALAESAQLQLPVYDAEIVEDDADRPPV